ncbi:hypothetical protein T484DRAFT_1748455 [Baffinella frigidus]|nr:hypothetical protein T484DRAFT_1748455 [Cryptophyta sp. CCMP2293]
MNDAARALRALLLVAVLDGGSSFSLAPLSAGVLSRCSTGRCENAAAFKRRIAPPSRQPVMSLFPDGGGMDQDTVEGPGLVGFWALLSADMDQGPIVLRADGQIGGGPKVPGWEDPGVKWASEMRIAGGKWEQFTGEDGRSGLRLEFLVPPRGRVHRERSQLTAPELRERLLYTGTLIEMLEDDGKKQTKVLRCFGSVEHIGAPITPVEEGVAAAEVQASPAISRFSLVKTDTTQFTKLIPTVKVCPAVARSIVSPCFRFRFQKNRRVLQDVCRNSAKVPKQTGETVTHSSPTMNGRTDSAHPSIRHTSKSEP